MPRKPRRAEQVLNEKLETAWSVLVRARAGYVCEVCDSPSNLQAHHMFGRGGSVKYDLRTGVSLCKGHHHFFAHESPSNADWWEWVHANREADYQHGYPLKGQSRKWTAFEKRELLADFAAQILEYEAMAA